tara:strand:+ start:235 stop:786 length:552 start_codon:yes stop_codon:yes gene_type:complete
MYLKDYEVPEAIQKYVEIKTNLFGEKYVTDLRPSAGKSAVKSGNLFEEFCYEIMIKTLKSGKQFIKKKPKFICHFGLDREGDFEIISGERQIHIECKQLGNVESHFDKVSHVILNAISKCYGKEMWLVCDWNEELGNRGKRYINALLKKGQETKEKVALQGNTFELVLAKDLQKFCEELTFEN